MYNHNIYLRLAGIIIQNQVKQWMYGLLLIGLMVFLPHSAAKKKDLWQNLNCSKATNLSVKKNVPEINGVILSTFAPKKRETASVTSKTQIGTITEKDEKIFTLKQVNKEQTFSVGKVRTLKLLQSLRMK